MKVLEVIPYFFPANYYGGPPVVVYNLAKYLIKKGVKTSVLTTDVKDKNHRVEKKEDIIDGIRTYYLRNLNNKLAFKYQLFLPDFSIFNLPIKIKEYDLVHIHCYRYLLGTYISLLCQKDNIPYIISGHGTIFKYTKRIFKSLFDLVLGNKELLKAKRVIAISPLEVKEFINFGLKKENIILIPNGVTLKKTKGNLFDLRAKYNLNNKKVIAYLGRISKSKGIEYLLKSFALFKKGDLLDTTVLVIAGFDFGFINELRKLIKYLKLTKSVFLIGPVSEEDKYNFFKSIDLIVYPTADKADIFGLVIYEALLSGVPVIVSNRCGSVNLIKQEELGDIVKYGDVKSLSEKMKNILDSKSKIMIKNRKKFVRENLSWDIIGSRLLKIYKEII